MDILLILKTAQDFLDVLMVIFGLNFAQLLYFGTKVKICVSQVIEFLLWGVKISFRFLAQTEHTPLKLLSFVIRHRAVSKKKLSVISENV